MIVTARSDDRASHELRCEHSDVRGDCTRRAVWRLVYAHAGMDARLYVCDDDTRHYRQADEARLLEVDR